MSDEKKKPAKDLTTEEVAKRLFPKEVRDAAKTEALKSPAAPKRLPRKH